MASACVYIECPITGMILAVSRKDDPNAWGLPGGKVEPGQTELEAAYAELSQETGIFLFRKNMHNEQTLTEIFRREGGVTYRAFLEEDAFVVGQKAPGETGRVAWVTPEQLMAGPFGEYNRRLLQTIGRVDAATDGSQFDRKGGCGARTCNLTGTCLNCQKRIRDESGGMA